MQNNFLLLQLEWVHYLILFYKSVAQVAFNQGLWTICIFIQMMLLLVYLPIKAFVAKIIYI